jgi:hypothetical protein
MRILDGQAVHTATDLADFLECEHLTALGRKVIAGELQRPYFDDPTREVLAQKTEPWLSAWGADDWGRRYAATVSRPWDHEPTPCIWRLPVGIGGWRC